MKRPTELDSRLHILSLSIAHIFQDIYTSDNENIHSDNFNMQTELLEIYRKVRSLISRDDNERRFGAEQASRMMKGLI